MKVAILLSTYNGEKYLAEQIESIQKQTYSNWHLYIRDDGSSDNTVAIINKFVQKDNRIHFLKDECKHLRPMKSFFKLLEDVQADYYFFCDQDDFWLKSKLKIMLFEISKYQNTPAMVYCNLKCVDKDLQPLKNSFEKMIGRIRGKSRFIGNDVPGCVMVINNSLKKITLENLKFYAGIVMHDWWLALVAQQFGSIGFVDKKLVLYRQHGDNAIGAGKSGGFMSKLFQKDLIKKQRNLVKQTYLQSKAFKYNFYMMLDLQNKKFIDDLVACDSLAPVERIKILNKYKLHESSEIRTLIYKFFFSFNMKQSLRQK